MKNYIIPMLLTLMLTTTGVSTLLASNDIEAGLKLINYGEDAKAYSSGTIADSFPKIGYVSHVTGDNQTIGNKRLLGRGDLVYVTFHDPESISPGDFLSLYRKIHKVTHPLDGRTLGNLYNIVGVVEVVDIAQNPSTVRVHRSYSSIYPGDGLMPFVPPTTPEPVPASDLVKTEGMEGMIVDVPPSRTLIAQSHVVYIDWGRMEGMQHGDRLEVFRQRTGHPKRVIGELKVLAVGEHTSSTVITKSRFPFLRGDRFVFKQATPRHPKLVQEISKEEPLIQTAVVEEADTTPLEFVEEGDHATLVVEGLLDHIEFDSGEAHIKPEGVKILKQVSVALQDIDDKHIRVEGHTDNVEIGPTLKRTFPTNWELSKARATEVVRFLQDDPGLKSKGISKMGYASYLPVASNEDETGRQKNRRVEIVLYPSDPTKRELEEKLDADANHAKAEALNLITNPSPAAAPVSPADPQAMMNDSNMNSAAEQDVSPREMSEQDKGSVEKVAVVQKEASQSPEPESISSAGTSEDLPNLVVTPASSTEDPKGSPSEPLSSN